MQRRIVNPPGVCNCSLPPVNDDVVVIARRWEAQPDLTAVFRALPLRGKCLPYLVVVCVVQRPNSSFRFQLGTGYTWVRGVETAAEPENLDQLNGEQSGEGTRFVAARIRSCGSAAQENKNEALKQNKHLMQQESSTRRADRPSQDRVGPTNGQP